jgi:hypothetical protein
MRGLAGGPRDGAESAGAARRVHRERGPWRVFISFTSELDRKPAGRSYVAAARAAITGTGIVVVDMRSSFHPSERPPAELCRRTVLGCDLLVLICGFRYGTPVPERPEFSYTQLEYETAHEAGLPILALLLGDDAEGDREVYVDLAFGVKQEEFRARLRTAGLTVAEIADPGQLENRLLRALVDLAAGVAPAGNAPGELSAGDRNEFAGIELICRDLPLALLLSAYRVVRGDNVPIDGLGDAAAIVARLADGLVGSAGAVLDHDLIDFALTLGQGVEGAAGDDIEAWVRTFVERREISPPVLENLRRRSVERWESRARMTYLLIRLDDRRTPAGETRYALSVTVHPDRGTVTPLAVGDDDRLHTLDEVRLMVGREVLGWAALGDQDALMIEFLVPRHLLDIEFDLWPVDDDDHDLIGARYGVILRDLDRTRRPGEAVTPWERRWKLLNGPAAAPTAARLHWVDPTLCGSREQLAARLRRISNRQWGCLGFPPSDDKDRLDVLRSAGIELGAPAILWYRGSGAGGVPIAELETMFADTPLPALPAKVLDLRQEASEYGDAEHCGRFIALLWDDPHRRPAAMPLLVAPDPRSS